MEAHHSQVGEVDDPRAELFYPVAVDRERVQALAPRQRGRQPRQPVVAEVQLHEALAPGEVAGRLGEDVHRQIEALESVAHAFESDEPGRDALEVLEGPDDLGDARRARIGRIAPGHGVAERLLLREKLLARARAKLGERRVLLVLIVHVVVVVLVGVVGVGYGPLVLGGGRPVPRRRDILRLAMLGVVARSKRERELGPLPPLPEL